MAELERKRILVVDDESTAREFYQALLKKHGYDADVAVDGNDAFRKVNRTAYDLVHMDIRMPNQDGVGSAISIGLVRPDIPILVVSGFLDDNVLKELEKESNIRGWMKKPTGAEAYLNAVRRILDGFDA
ncbi:MAG: response regulator [Candidatus Aenigmarchaeota archaeon]|nr:response regulator [Candidatus Aenigmarchaeota archaeon]